MKCPKDGSPMQEKTVNGVALDACPKCGGVWMDAGKLSRVSSGKVTEHELTFRGDSRRICPKCGKQMRKADLHSVIVEECECGMFFDQGEIKKVLGLELGAPARKIELTAAQLDELKAKGRVRAGDSEIILKK